MIENWIYESGMFGSWMYAGVLPENLANANAASYSHLPIGFYGKYTNNKFNANPIQHSQF